MKLTGLAILAFIITFLGCMFCYYLGTIAGERQVIQRIQEFTEERRAELDSLRLEIENKEEK